MPGSVDDAGAPEAVVGLLPSHAVHRSAATISGGKARFCRRRYARWRHAFEQNFLDRPRAARPTRSPHSTHSFPIPPIYHFRYDLHALTRFNNETGRGARGKAPNRRKMHPTNPQVRAPAPTPQSQKHALTRQNPDTRTHSPALWVPYPGGSRRGSSPTRPQDLRTPRDAGHQRRPGCRSTGRCRRALRRAMPRAVSSEVLRA